MFAFEIVVNGEKKCVAGDANVRVLSAIVHGPPDFGVRVGGLIGEAHTQWLKTQLKPGDEITFRLIETEAADEPIDRSFSDTRAEREEKVKNHLEKARTSLPDVLQESEAANLQLYRVRLSQNHLMGAMDVLAALGDESGAGSDFWKELSYAAHRQSSYEDSGRYGEKWKAMETAQKNAPQE